MFTRRRMLAATGGLAAWLQQTRGRRGVDIGCCYNAEE